MAPLKTYNVKEAPTASSPEGQYYVKSDDGLILEHWIVSNGKAIKIAENLEREVERLNDTTVEKLKHGMLFIDDSYPWIDNSMFTAAWGIPQFSTDADFKRTDYIDCSEAQSIIVSKGEGVFCGFFSEKALSGYLSWGFSLYEVTNFKIDVPPDAKYVIINYKKSVVGSNPFAVFGKGNIEVINAGRIAYNGIALPKILDSITVPNLDFTWNVIGDSISTNWYHGFETWNSIVARKLKITNFSNFAEGGAVWTDAATGLQKFSQQVTELIADNQAKNRTLNLITISLGTNNILSDLSDYDAIMSIPWGVDGSAINRLTVFGGMRWGVETLKRTYPQVIIIASTPVPRCDGDYDAELIAMGDAIKKMMRNYGVLVVDAYAESGISSVIDKTIAKPDPFTNGNYFFADKLHLNDGGHGMLAKYMMSRIEPFIHF